MAGVGLSANETEGTFNVPAYTMAVFVKPQGESQGAGLSADATVGAPDIVPYGSTEVYLRGDLNVVGSLINLNMLVSRVISSIFRYEV